MTQDKQQLPSLTVFQKQVLNELGISRWRLGDSAQLAPVMKQCHAGSVSTGTDEIPSENPSSGVAENKTTASDTLAQLSNRLSGNKSKTVTPTPVAKKVEEVLLQDVSAQMAQDLVLAFESLGINIINKPCDETVTYPLVISDSANLKNNTKHFFASRQLNDSNIKKRLWQAMQQG